MDIQNYRTIKTFFLRNLFLEEESRLICYDMERGKK